MVTIEPDADDGPRRDGDVRIRWSGILIQGLKCLSLSRARWRKWLIRSPRSPSICSRNGRMTGESPAKPFWTLGQTEWERARILGSILKQLAELFSRDEIWNIVAAPGR